MNSNDGQKTKQTTVEEGTEFQGTLNSTCPVVVHGALDGDIKAPSLTVTSSGTVVGKVNAESIRSEGVLAGNVDADDVFLSGSVRSDTVIRAKTLEVKLRSDNAKLEVTFGECILEVGDEPSAEKKAEPADSKSASKAAKSEGEALSVSDSGAQGKKKDASEENGKSERLSVPPPA